jgi:hypothetical protein
VIISVLLFRSFGCQKGTRLHQIADLFRTTHKVKTVQVVKSQGQHCGDIELAGYLANATGPVPFVLDLRIAHDRFGSSSDPNLNGNLHYPNDIDRALNEAAADKIRKYRSDTIITHSSLSHSCLLLQVRLGGYIVNLLDFYPYRLIGKLPAVLQLQKFSSRNLTVDTSTSAARDSPHCLNRVWATFSPGLQLYVLTLTLMGRLSHLSHILTHRILKLLVY